MPLPPEAKIIRKREGFIFDDFARPVKVIFYDYKIGNHGPFSIRLFVGEDNPAHVERLLSEEVLKFRQLGMLPETTS